MALADYFQRAAVAAAQVLQGFDEDMLRARLDDRTVGLSLGASADTPEGRALADMAVRLLARLYPKLTIATNDPWCLELTELASAINPNITIETYRPDVALVVGDGDTRGRHQTVFAGSDGWDALISSTTPRSVGKSDVPFGAGAAAAMGAANVFRAVFLTDPSPDLDLRLSCAAGADGAPGSTPVDVGTVVLVGAGAIGHAAAWALARTPLTGELHIVDHQDVEVSNLQRYVLARRADDGNDKAPLLAAYFTGNLGAIAHSCTWQSFVADQRPPLSRVLVALDSARDRRAVQAALPDWIANAWTQPGDLGVSIHPSFLEGACLACLYLPTGKRLNEDELVAQALGLEHSVWGLALRNLLHGGGPVTPDLLDAAAESLGVPHEAVQTFAGRSIRELYVEGVCGGALVPLDRAAAPAPDLHVPVAHQSALAGVLLAAKLVATVATGQPTDTEITRVDLLRPVGSHLTQPAAKDPRGICICQDPVYQAAYRAKHGPLRLVR